MLKSHGSIIEILTKSNVKVLEDSTQAIQASKKTILETIEKFEKLLQDFWSFMTDFRSTTNSNTEFMNKVIVGFPTSMQAKKEALFLVCFNIKQDTNDFNASFVS